ncbi:MAG: zinc ribbon domain-containing protein [Bellilinea sp.]
MRRLFVIFVLLVGLLTTVPAQAQSAPVIESMEIGLWPEYDRADVLVIYRITLSPEVNLPVQMSIRIPADVDAPYNLAMKEVDGLLYNLAYTSEVEGEWLKVTFTTPSAELQLEYYDPGLTREATQRSFEYIWNGDFAINDLAVAIQQPVNATDMQVLPDFGVGIAQEDGLTYFTKQVGKVPAGTPVTVRFSYVKSDDSLSFGSQSVQPVQAASGDAAGRVNAGDFLPWVLGGVGLVLILGGVVWFMATRNRSAVSPGKKRHRSTNRQDEMAASQIEQIFCPKCGRRASASDLFCRACGNRLRSE